MNEISENISNTETHSMYSNPFLRNPNRRPFTQEKLVFTCLCNDSKDGPSLASCGREFQRLGAASEKALSRVPTTCTSEGGRTKRKASSDDINTHAGWY